MTPEETQRLAGAMNALRPDWPVTSLRTFITNELATRAYRDAAVALTRVACDQASKTPRRVLENGPWWAAVVAREPESERHPANTPISKLCPNCHRHSCDCDQATVERRRRRQGTTPEAATRWAAIARSNIHTPAEDEEHTA